MIFFSCVKSKALVLVKSFPTNFTPKLIVSVKSMSFAFLDCLTLSICSFFSHVEDIAGDEPEEAPLVPGLGVPGLLLLHGWVVFVFPQAEMTYQRHIAGADDATGKLNHLLMTFHSSPEIFIHLI